MPAVIPVHTAIRNLLRESVTEALGLDSQLAVLVAARPSRPSGGFHGKIDFSQPPWHAPVAQAHLELHAFSRRFERELRHELDLPPRYRGGSDDNTPKALEAICRLSEKADDFIVRLGNREIGKWCRRASIALELTEVPRRVPRSPGQPEPRCPFCSNHTLRTRPLEAQVYCINPGCRDENGKKPEAHLEFSVVAQDWVMVWQDGIAGVPAA